MGCGVGTMTETARYIRDVMVDLETLGTTPGAPILSIGAVEFVLDGDVLGREFYRNTIPEFDGAQPDASTLYWWFQQSDEARKRLTTPEPIHLTIALPEFEEWLTHDRGNEFRIWSHGPSFDIAFLEMWWRRVPSVEGRTPWRYDAARDTRTLFHAAGIDWDREMEIQTAVEHDALEDAKGQARVVQTAWAKLREQVPS